MQEKVEYFTEKRKQGDILMWITEYYRYEQISNLYGLVGIAKITNPFP